MDIELATERGPDASNFHVRRRRRPGRDRARPEAAAAHRRDRARRPGLHLRQRPAPLPLDAGLRAGQADGPRVPRRRRGGRLRGVRAGRGRPGGRAVRLVRRHLRVLPGGPAHLLPARRVLGRGRCRRRPGRGGPGAAGRRARWSKLPVGEDSRAAAVAADAVRRVRHRLPRRGQGRGEPAHDGHRDRRRRGRADGGAVGQAAGRRADHPDGPPPATAPTSAASSAPPTSWPSAARRASPGCASSPAATARTPCWRPSGTARLRQAVGRGPPGRGDQPGRGAAVRGGARSGSAACSARTSP